MKLQKLLQKEESRNDSGLDADLSSSDLQLHQGESLQEGSHGNIHSNRHSSHSKHHGNNNSLPSNHVNTNHGDHNITSVQSQTIVDMPNSCQCHFDRNVKGQSGARGSNRSIRSMLSRWNLFRIRRRQESVYKAKSSTPNQKDTSMQMNGHCVRGQPEYLGYQPKRNYYLSGRIRDSIGDIAQHMDIVDNLTSRLRDSIAMDIHKYSIPHPYNVPLPYGGQCNSMDLAGSIVDSYNLERDDDTMSYVSNHLSYSPHHSGYRRAISLDGAGSCDVLERSHDNLIEGSTGQEVSSAHAQPHQHTVYTLGNDKYYPGATSRRQQRATGHKVSKRGRRYSNRGRWKRPPKPKVFTLQQPQEALTIGNGTSAATTREIPSLVSFV